MRELKRFNLSGAIGSTKTVSSGKNYFGLQGNLQPSPVIRELSVIFCIESFEITILIRLFFTGFECEKGAVGMFLADIGNTEPQ